MAGWYLERAEVVLRAERGGRGVDLVGFLERFAVDKDLLILDFDRLAFAGDDNNFSFAADNLLDIRNHLLVNSRGHGYTDYGAVFVNKGNRPMLHFSSSITFSRDIGNFF